jgi:adenosylcobinamide-GDP ribazoletransferase
MSINPPFHHRVWTGFVSAVQFLTIIPLKSNQSFDARRSLPYYPLCGLLIGIILVIFHYITNLFWPSQIAALLDVTLLAVITGALHLDGLADTTDGLYGHRDPQHALTIMKDSRIGSMGSVSMILCLAAKWVGLSYINSCDFIWLFLVPAYARATVPFGVWSLPYGRPDGGTAHALFKDPIKINDFWGLGILVVLSLITGWKFIILNLTFALIVFIVIWWYKKKIQCITGDMLGAMIEITEAALFIVAAIQWQAS